MRLTFIAAVLGAALICQPAFATQDVENLANVSGTIYVRVTDAAGHVTSAPFWTIDMLGGVTQKGIITGSGAISVSGLDRKLRSGARDDDRIEIVKEDLKPAYNISLEIQRMRDKEPK